jgi:hypothetical protein
MAVTTERAPMFGVSFFGVTPGFTHRDFCSEDTILPSIIRECTGLYTLDQFTVRLPRNGTLYIFGGQIVDERHVTFIGLYRHAIEYKGSREGGHYGVGIWLVDSWLGRDARDVRAVLDFLDQMMGFLSDQLVDAEGRVIRTFEQMDWGAAPALLQTLGEYRIRSAPMRDGECFDGMRRKFLLAHDAKPNAPDSTRKILSQIIQLFGTDPVILRDRVIYTSFDESIVQAIRELNRVEVINYDNFIERYIKDLEKRNPDPTSDANQRQSSLVLTEGEGHSRLSIRPTIPVRDDYGDNAGRSTARSSSKSPIHNGKSSSRFHERPSSFNRSTSDIVAQLLKLSRVNIASSVAGALLAIVVFVFVPDMWGSFRSSTPGQSKPRSQGAHRVDLPKSDSKEQEGKSGSSNATNSARESECLKLKNTPPEASDKDPEQFSKDVKAVEKRIKDRIEKRSTTATLSGDELRLLSLALKERDYLKCLEGRPSN